MKSIRSGRSSVSGAGDTVQKHSDQVFAEMGLYRGNMVAVKRVQVIEAIPDRQDLLDFKTVSCSLHCIRKREIFKLIPHRGWSGKGISFTD